MFIFSGNHAYFTYGLSFLYLSSLTMYLAQMKPKVGELRIASIMNR